MIPRVSVDLTSSASSCTILARARALAAWVGDGKSVTAKGVLRPVDARAAAHTTGISVPAHIRSAADVPALHHPWLAAQATGMLTVDTSHAAARPATGGEEPLSTWQTGLDAVLRAESRDQPRRQGAEVLCRMLLGLLDTDPPPTTDKLPYSAYQLLDHCHDPIEADAAIQAFDRGVEQVGAALTVLAAFDAIDHNGRITPLGRWAHGQLRARVPPSVRGGAFG